MAINILISPIYSSPSHTYLRAMDLQGEKTRVDDESSFINNKTSKVCVTGASGYLGSSLVRTLLKKGYKVNATVRNPSKAQFLRSIPYADQHLKIFEADLLKEGSFDEPINGCHGVFLVASPVILDPQDAERDVVEAAIRGTMNVLRSCERVKSVQRVVFTSSVRAALYWKGSEQGHIPVDESCWSSVDWLRLHKPNGWGYRVSKALAEKAAFEFGKEKGIQVLSVLPALVVGPWLTESVPKSVGIGMSAFTGDRLLFSMLEPSPPGFIHEDDMAEAQVFVMESSQASGRYNCCAHNASLPQFLEFLRQRYPHHLMKITNSSSSPNKGESKDEESIFDISSEKLKSLGFVYKYDLAQMFDQTLHECVAIQHVTTNA